MSTRQTAEVDLPFTVYPMPVTGVLDASLPPYNGSVQAALNALPTTGGTVYVPRGGYHVNPPLLVQKGQTTLLGDEAFGKTVLQDNFGGGAVVYVVPPGKSPTLVSSLLTGVGAGLRLGTTNTGSYILSDYSLCHFDGAALFTAELTVRLESTPSDHRNFFGSAGQRTSADPRTVAFQLNHDAVRVPRAVLTVGGVQYTLTGSSMPLTVGTVYRLALTYDGSTIRLLGGTPGGTWTQLASQAASGTVTQQLEEHVIVGYEPLGWPSLAGRTAVADCTLDAVRLSNSVRYNPGDACSAAKPGNGGDSNTLILLNFANFLGDGGVLNGEPGMPTGGPILIGRSRGGNVYLLWQPDLPGNGITQVRLKNLTISGGDTGVMIWRTTEFRMERLDIASSVGIKALQNSFNGYFQRISGGGGLSPRAPSGQTVNQALVWMGDSSGGNLVDCNTPFGGHAYTLVAGGGCDIRTLRSTTSPDTIAHVLVKGSGSGTDIAYLAQFGDDDEPSGTPSNFIAGCIFDNVPSVIFEGGEVATASSGVANVCVRFEGTTRTALFNGTVFVGGKNTTKVFGGSIPPTLLTRATAIKLPADDNVLPWS